MTEYIFASDEHRAEIIDFINYVFSQSSMPHNFKTLIPKVYADGRGKADIHAIALEEGRVRGVVAQLPFEMQINDEKMKIGYIGSVSTYPYTRGSGHMKALMNMQIERAKADGIDLMLLGGQRQRYEYFGFSPVGHAFEYYINASNVRHALKNVATERIKFIEFVSATKSQIDAAYAIYTNKTIKCARSREDFKIVLATWNTTAYVICSNDNVIGYVNVRDDIFYELALKDMSDTPAIVKAWYERFSAKHIKISAPPYEEALNRELSAFSEGYTMFICEHARVVNLKNVLSACLRLKQATGRLLNGEVILQMDDDTPVKAKVCDPDICVEYTDEAPDVKLSRLDMQQYLFSANPFSYPGALKRPSWLPLDIFLDRADQF